MKNKFFLGFFYRLISLINRLLNLKKNCVTVINYHGIEEKYVENFKLQIEWLSKNYKIISPEEFFDFIDGKNNVNEHSFVITFDDGFVSSYNSIQKVLNPLGIKTIFFIPSIFVNNSNKKWEEIISKNFFSGKLDINNFPYSYKPIDEKKIKNLISQGHKIGGHTHSHLDISKINSDELLQIEIIDPIEIYKSTFNIRLNSFAFPYGRINHINYYLLKIISDNYSYCFSNIRGTNFKKTSRLAIKRQNISPDMPINYFGFIIEGGLDFYWKSHSKKLNDLSESIFNKTN